MGSAGWMATIPVDTCERRAGRELMTRSKTDDSFAALARRYCNPTITITARRPSAIGDFPRIIDERVDPNVTDTTKSKAFNLDIVLFPEMRMNANNAK